MMRRLRRNRTANFKAKLVLAALRGDKTLAELAWRISNTLKTDFYVEALQGTLGRYGKSEIFNTDQGSQFTSEDYTGIFKENGIQISMYGKGP